MKQLVLSLIFILTSATSGRAQALTDMKLSQSFSAVAANPSQTQKEGLFNELLSSQASGLAWPDFPRTWIQKDVQKYIETTTSFIGSLNLPESFPIAGGISYKYNIAYKYNTRISFVAITKMRIKEHRAESASSKVSQAPLSGDDLEAIRYFDPKTNKNYFRAGPDNPMIGFCVYEMSMTINKSQDSSISFTAPLVGASQTNTGADVQTESQAIYSKFFQIDPKISEMDYLKIKCEKNFQEMVRPFVENDFNKILIEYYTYNHPRNECTIGGVSTDQGDENCQAWFKATQNTLTQKMTVPRCLQSSDGISRCSLRSRLGMDCSLYLDKQGQYSERWTGYYREATLNTYAHSCDEGLRCQMAKEPIRVGGLILWPGVAACKNL